MNNGNPSFGPRWSQEELNLLKSRANCSVQELTADPLIVEIMNRRSKAAFFTKFYKTRRQVAPELVKLTGPRKKRNDIENDTQEIEPIKRLARSDRQLNHCPCCGVNLLAIRAALTLQ
jgi:hypothetical protein